MRNRVRLIANGLGFKNKFFSFSPPWHLIYGKPNTTKGVEFKIPYQVSVIDRRDWKITSRMKKFHVRFKLPIENEKTSI